MLSKFGFDGKGGRLRTGFKLGQKSWLLVPVQHMKAASTKEKNAPWNYNCQFQLWDSTKGLLDHANESLLG